MKEDSSIFLLKIRSLNIKNSDTWISEALFGFNNIKEFCKKKERLSITLNIQ